MASSPLVEPMAPPIMRETRPELRDIIHGKLESLYICGNLECRTVSNVAGVCPSCTSPTTKLAPLVESEATELAHEMAFDKARIDIHSFAIPASEGATRWNDLDLANATPDEADDLQTAVRYLELRGKVIRHPLNRDWVRVEDGE